MSDFIPPVASQKNQLYTEIKVTDLEAMQSEITRIAELEAEVKRLREALENIKCGIIVRDPANTILKRVNDALNELAASGKHKGGKDGTDIFTQQKGT